MSKSEVKYKWIQCVLKLSPPTTGYAARAYDVEIRGKNRPIICARAIVSETGSLPDYLRFTLSTKQLKGSSYWRALGHNGYQVVADSNGVEHYIYNLLDQWVHSLDSRNFWAKFEPISEAEYQAGV